MSSFDACYSFRDEMLERLERDLVGPADQTEGIDDFPLERYICGILYPSSEDPIDPSQDDELAEGDDQTVYTDPPVARANERYPSSAGITFAVDLSRTSEIGVTVGGALYTAEETDDRKIW